jgi:putative ABC transport system permease protein
MQSESLSGFPISINTSAQSVDMTNRGAFNSNEDTKYTKYPSDNIIYNYNSSANTKTHKNIITEDYLKYISKITESLPNSKTHHNPEFV